jgi:uncharacterized membrane protein YfcA
MTITKFLDSYKNLIFSAITFYVGIKMIINHESKFLNGLFILTISFGFLLNFISSKTKNQRLNNWLKYLTYLIVILIVAYLVIEWFIV